MSAVEQLFNGLSKTYADRKGFCCSVGPAKAAIHTTARQRISLGSSTSKGWSNTMLDMFCDEPCAFSYTDKPQKCAICHIDSEKGLLFNRSTRPQFFAGTTCMTNVIVNMYLLNFTYSMEEIIDDELTRQFKLSEWLSLWNCLMELTSPLGHRLSPDTRMAMLQEYIPMYHFWTQTMSDQEDESSDESSSDDESTGIEPVEMPSAPKRQLVLDSSDDESTGIEPMPSAPKRQRVAGHPMVIL